MSHNVFDSVTPVFRRISHAIVASDFLLDLGPDIPADWDIGMAFDMLMRAADEGAIDPFDSICLVKAGGEVLGWTDGETLSDLFSESQTSGRVRDHANSIPVSQIVSIDTPVLDLARAFSERNHYCTGSLSRCG